MSKNLDKASAWIKKEIDQLNLQLAYLNTQVQSANVAIEETTAKIEGFKEMLEKLPKEVKSGINAIETHNKTA